MSEICSASIFRVKWFTPWRQAGYCSEALVITCPTTWRHNQEGPKCGLNWGLLLLEYYGMPLDAMARDSSVGIATRWGLDGQGIKSRCWRDFTQFYTPALVPTQPTVKWVPRLFLEGRVQRLKRVWLHLYSSSGTSWPVLEWTLLDGWCTTFRESMIFRSSRVETSNEDTGRSAPLRKPNDSRSYLLQLRYSVISLTFRHRASSI